MKSKKKFRGKKRGGPHYHEETYYEYDQELDLKAAAKFVTSITKSLSKNGEVTLDEHHIAPAENTRFIVRRTDGRHGTQRLTLQLVWSPEEHHDEDSWEEDEWEEHSSSDLPNVA